MASSSSTDMRSLSSAVTATGSAPGAGVNGAPTTMRSGVPRVRSRLRPLVMILWLPQTTVGSRGTPASRAIRAAPVLKSLSSKDVEMVASGKTPTISPARSAVTASW